MKIKIKTGIKKVKEFLSRALVFLAQHVSFTCLLLFFLTLIFSGLVFYKYSILIQKKEPEISEPFRLKEETYQEILKIWQRRKKRIEEADSKTYIDLFKGAIFIIEEESPGEED